MHGQTSIPRPRHVVRPDRPVPPLRAALVALSALAALAAWVGAAGFVSRASAADEGGAPGAGGGQKYDLKLNLKEGQRWDFDLRNQSSLKQQVNAGGQQQLVESASESVRKGTLAVLSAKDGVPTAIKVTFDKSSATEARNNGQNTSIPFPLAGKTVTVRKDESGNLTHDAGDLDSATAAELTNLLEPDKTTYPPHPVGVGDEWEADTRKMAQQFQLGPDDRVSIKCKLLKIGSVGGRKTADVSVAGSVRKVAQGVTLNVTLGGVTQIDLASGEPLQSDVIGKIATKGNLQAKGPNGPVPVDITGDGKVETHQTVSPGGEGAGADAGGGAGGGRGK